MDGAVKDGYADENADYWEDYSPLQQAKHDLVRHYLGGWFPKLGTWAGRVLYVDTHAGRGRYASGATGSPIVALETFLKHQYREQLLQRSEVLFWFIERDEQNLASLHNLITALGPLPQRITVHPQAANSFEVLQQVVAELHKQASKMAPAFIFVDPYGFKIPGRLLRDLMNAGRVELLVTFMWRGVDMAIARARNSPSDKLAATLDALFDTPEWRSRIVSCNSVKRAKEASELLRQRIGAKWFTDIKMLGENNAIRYLMLHFTNHDAGRDLMKDCIWKICPDGGLHVRMGDNPAQEFLIRPTPNLSPLTSWVLGLLAKRPREWKELSERLRAEIWLETHLRKVLEQLVADKRI